MADNPTWLGHDKYRDLPMLGIDPDAPMTWEPVDDGRRPDNREPEEFVEFPEEWGGFDYAGPAMKTPIRGKRPDIGQVRDYSLFVAEGDGRALMEYHRQIATAQVEATDPVTMVEAVMESRV